MGFAWFSMSTIWFGCSLHHRPPRLYLKSVEFEFFWGIIRKQTKKIRPKICLENILETFRLESVYGKSQGRHSLICPKRVCTSQQGMVSGVCKQVQQVYDAITLFRECWTCRVVKLDQQPVALKVLNRMWTSPACGGTVDFFVLIDSVSDLKWIRGPKEGLLS